MEVGEGGREVVELLAEFGGGDELESSEGGREVVDWSVEFGAHKGE